MRKIKKITPAALIAPEKKKVAAYARVSVQSELMDHSLSNQISYFNRLIQSNPEWDFVEVYTDHGITGTSIKDRSGFQRMVEDAKAGKIDIILTKSVTRFARNTVDLLNTVRDLKTIGVEVRFEKENINSLSGDGELMLSILASFAQEESYSISENVKWGTVKRFKEGKPNGRFHIYGYRWDDDDLVPKEDEAKVVQRIYSEYLSGKNKSQIAHDLNADGIPTRYGKKWIPAGVRSILGNIHYTGCLVFQKEFQEDPISGKTRKNNGELAQYRVDNHHPAIISEETFERAQELRIPAPTNYGRFNPNPKHKVLKKLFICGKCGRPVGCTESNIRGKKYTFINCVYDKKKHTCHVSQLNLDVFIKVFQEETGLEDFSPELLEKTLKQVVMLGDKKLKFVYLTGKETIVDYSKYARPGRKRKEVNNNGS